MNTYNFSGLNIISGSTVTNLSVGGGNTTSSLVVSGVSLLQNVTTTSMNIGGKSLFLDGDFGVYSSPLTFLVLTSTSLILPQTGYLSGSAGGPLTSLQYNSLGTFGGSASLTWSGTASQLRVGNSTAGTIALADGKINKNSGFQFTVDPGITPSTGGKNSGTSGIPWNFIYGNNIINSTITTSNLIVTGSSVFQNTTLSSLLSTNNSIINGKIGSGIVYGIISDISLNAGSGFGYTATCTYQYTGSSFSVGGVGVSGSVTSLKYNGATGTSVTIDQRSNYLLSVNGTGGGQILGALYYIQTANDNTGVSIYGIGTNGIYGAISVGVSANGTFSGGSGTVYLRVTITASSGSGSYNFTVTLTEVGKSLA